MNKVPTRADQSCIDGRCNFFCAKNAAANGKFIPGGTAAATVKGEQYERDTNYPKRRPAGDRKNRTAPRGGAVRRHFGAGGHHGRLRHFLHRLVCADAQRHEPWPCAAGLAGRRADYPDERYLLCRAGGHDAQGGRQLCVPARSLWRTGGLFKRVHKLRAGLVRL